MTQITFLYYFIKILNNKNDDNNTNTMEYERAQKDVNAELFLERI